MVRVLIYSALLIFGMVLSQVPSIDDLRPQISAVTMIFLAYIMIQVGMEFEIDKSQPQKYALDYLVAMGAAAVPWLTAAAYFWWFFQVGSKEGLLIGRFAAPTSAGILFTMLAAAGLATTWTYKKARVLAIFDDLDLLTRKLQRCESDVIFNLADQFKNNRAFDQNIVAFLAMRGVAFTGCGSTGLTRGRWRCSSLIWQPCFW